jgi:hypothetical protein
MGDVIFGLLLVLIFVSIIGYLYQTHKHTGHMCSCSACPVSKFVNEDGKIDLLAAIDDMNKE